ncbi:MAG TPA: cation:proton antiporter [Candidatus Sabulitectum sp.]|nr:cation:proton antiporter [Candidatus Sabulitectum sp.]HPF31403.1 cation:proton antiporter [Candidatus Sabulitectum sp.]HPJ27787.1 cation:proton antiporter [Candidatus Sabulitectum sp.]HPR21669.1 cation:proton antiporter [Candidatus Sabulitectum sp.]HRW77702.1 cation:proton antiporter [Candidatus Sabulitectum sp.]
MSITGILLEFRDTVSVHPVFGLGILLVGAWFLGWLVEKRGIPAVSGFVLAGMLLGPQVTGMVHGDLYARMQPITQIAVAVIAVVIGSEFRLARMRKIGRAMASITASQLAVTFLLTSAALAVTGHLPLHTAAVLGAIATATSPTATVTIIRDLNARGPFIDHLYGAIPLDDAGCIVLFAVVMAIAAGFLQPGEASVAESVLHFAEEMGGSLILGLLTGLALRKGASAKYNMNSIYIVSLGLLCLMAALAAAFHLSPLLAGMAAGAVMANSPKGGRKVVEALELLAPPLYAVFFAIAGAELEPGVLGDRTVLAAGGIYILARAAGKYSGVWLGAALSGSEPEIRRYLGLAMLPHSGVTIGLLLYLQTSESFAAHSGHLAPLVVSVVLMSVLVNELLGPVLAKLAIQRAVKEEGRR